VRFATYHMGADPAVDCVLASLSWSSSTRPVLHCKLDLGNCRCYGHLRDGHITDKGDRAPSGKNRRFVRHNLSIARIVLRLELGCYRALSVPRKISNRNDLSDLYLWYFPPDWAIRFCLP